MSGQGKVSIDGGPAADTMKKSVTTGKNVAIKAIPDQGWKFSKWSDDITTADRNITVKANAKLIAYFEMEKTEASDDKEDNPSDIDIQGIKIITDADREGGEEGYYYTGTAIKPKITVYDYDINDGEPTLLINGKDYTVKYANNINAAYDEEGALSQLRNVSNGKEMAGAITRTALYNSKKSATFFTDEELVRFNPQMPYIIILWRGNYEGFTYVNFVINPVSIADEANNKKDYISISVNDDFASPKKDKTVIKSIKYKKTLKINSDYEASLVPAEDNHLVDINDATISSALEAGKIPANVYGKFMLKITGIKNYAGTISLPVFVRNQNAIQLSKVSVKFNQTSYIFDENGLDFELIDRDPALEDKSKNCFAVVLGDKYLTDEDIKCFLDTRNAGKGLITITPKNSDYYGKKIVSFNIKGTPINNAVICLDGEKLTDKSLGELPYKGEEYSYEDIMNEKAIQLMLDTVPLEYNVHFTVEFSKVCDLPGTYTIKFVGKKENGYTGSLSRTLTIKKVDINSDSVTFANENSVSSSAYEFVNEGVTEPGKDIAKRKGILFNGETLAEGTDYTIRFTNNKAIGTTAIMTITGKGRFTGSKDIPFEIIPRVINGPKDDDNSYRLLSVVAKPMYYKDSVKEYKPAITVKYDNVTLKKDKDYSLSYNNNSQEAVEAYRENRNNFEPSVDIEFIGKYSGRIENIPISIYDKANTINKNTASAVLSGDYSYDGKNIRPGYVLYYSSDSVVIKNLNALIKANNKEQINEFIKKHRDLDDLIELKEDEDYYVSYGKNIFAGKSGGYILFNGIGSSKSSYGGSIKVTFKIGGKKISNPVIDFLRKIIGADAGIDGK